MTERRPPDEPDQGDDQDESEFEPAPDGPPEIEDAARQEVEYPADETDEG
ncbi:MAG: hypothetical protein M3Q30_04625 [Actinomycetota bacterium]|nr:hypothetical protein [Actinomycetota bacterium]